MIPWVPQSGPQEQAIRKAFIEELFYGGAVGGGKSDFLLGDFAQDVPTAGAAWQGILFRRTYPELSDLIRRSQEIYPSWFPGVVWHDTDKEWRWPNGAILRMRYLESSSDWMRYWGHAYTWIGWDELPAWSSMTSYFKMKARLRSAHAVEFKRIRATGNPGGASHHEVKQYFGIDMHPLGGHVIHDEQSGMRRIFIRSRLEDNRILLQNDPGYGDRLYGLGSEALVKAWREGDWNVIAGAFFPEFSTERHVVAPVALPDHWLRFRACDWGSAKPFSVGWYAVSEGDLEQFPRGALVKYREWYGMADGQPNVGIKLTAEEVADGIVDRDDNGYEFKWPFSVIDPSAYAENGGPSIAERMLVRTQKRVAWREADNKRVAQKGALGGWDQLRARLKGDEDGRPMLYFFSTCVHTIRTLPALQHDDGRPEDVDTEGEDHAPDETRYACMSRPYLRKPRVDEIPIEQRILEGTRMGVMVKHHFDRKRRERQEMSV